MFLLILVLVILYFRLFNNAFNKTSLEVNLTPPVTKFFPYLNSLKT